MSLRRLSPSANLLRNSRLFALPHPLPRPAADTTGTAAYDSDTATSPYPTHPALETPPTSLSRGDWGLKRSIPLRTTSNTSTPTIRIDNIDSIDNITDFSSAANHTRNLEKWQEIDIPLSTIPRQRRAAGTQAPPSSVFEPQVDNTAISEEEGQARWKFSGPWLAGLDEGEFQVYLAKKVQKRKFEFREFLRRRLARLQREDRNRQRADNVENPAAPSESSIDEEAIPDVAVDHYIRRIRSDGTMMQQVVDEFLDLPREKKFQTALMGRASYNDAGPPATHPSAGLSYLRTGTYTFNHPLHGPQDDRPPVKARVLTPQGDPGRPVKRAVLGVAGVATEDTILPFGKGDDVPEIQRFVPELVGGGKVWVEPRRAHIDVEGKIQLSTARAEKPAVLVHRSDRGETVPTEPTTRYASSRSSRAALNSINGQGRGQGYGLEDASEVPTRAKAEPLDMQTDLAKMLGKILEKS